MPAAANGREVSEKLGDARDNLSGVVNDVAEGKSPVVVEKSGLPVVAVISLEEYRRFKASEDEKNRAWNAIARISEAFSDIPLDELDAEVERAVAEVRAEMRAERAANH